MKFKKIVALSLTMMMSVGLLVGCGSKDSASNTDKVTVGMITDVGGVHDESFNQTTWEGLQAVEKELGEDKVKVKYLESKQDADYKPNIEQFADEELDLIIGVGYKLADAIEEAAKAYPEQQFAIVDHSYEKQPENVTSLVFEDNVSGYLVGLIAGKMTETNKVAFIGGMKSSVLAKFEYGFKAGVKDANPKAEILAQYANSFSDSALGKSIANSMMSNGVDVIFPCAGAAGIGAIEAVKEAGKYAIGVDKDQNDLAPDNVITSAMKNVNIAVGDMVKALVDGSYKPGEVKINTLATGGVGIAPTSEKNVPAEVLSFVDEKSKEIVDGKIVVPSTEEEYKKAYGDK
ncbi:BMP family ABC transporter substrate-binding protein [Terrisporobacter mayombei]|nr:BMP family ABC transporter substrate-binding protein [Terrisporobacter mayombei]